MSENANPSNSTNDKIATLTKEAENLKLKLEEERQKLNDVARKLKKTQQQQQQQTKMIMKCLFISFICGRTLGNDNVH